MESCKHLAGYQSSSTSFTPAVLAESASSPPVMLAQCCGGRYGRGETDATTNEVHSCGAGRHSGVHVRGRRAQVLVNAHAGGWTSTPRSRAPFFPPSAAPQARERRGRRG